MVLNKKLKAVNTSKRYINKVMVSICSNTIAEIRQMQLCFLNIAHSWTFHAGDECAWGGEENVGFALNLQGKKLGDACNKTRWQNESRTRQPFVWNQYWEGIFQQDCIGKVMPVEISYKLLIKSNHISAGSIMPRLWDPRGFKAHYKQIIIEKQHMEKCIFSLKFHCHKFSSVNDFSHLCFELAWVCDLYCKIQFSLLI